MASTMTFWTHHVLTKIHRYTFRAKITEFSFFTPQNFNLGLSTNISDDLSFLVINHKLCYLSLLNLLITFLVVLHLYFYFYVPMFHLFVIHHYKNRLSSLHIFVYH